MRVTLGDANDSPPRFLQEKYRAVIDEGAEKFEPELKVQARDKDKTSKINYSIVGGNEMGFFSIDTNTGEITIANRGPVDVTNSTQDWIELLVQASDGKFSDRAVVNVTVRDVNNNAPSFAQDVYTASVPEISKPGKKSIKRSFSCKRGFSLLNFERGKKNYGLPNLETLCSYHSLLETATVLILCKNIESFLRYDCSKWDMLFSQR